MSSVRARRVQRQVDELVEQWAAARPDLDRSSMAVISRIERLTELLDEIFTPTLAQYGLTRGDFDVLATLRRADEPYRLTPTELSRAMMISSGGTTKRVDRLEERGLLERSPDPNDRRGVVVALTPQGVAVVDEAVTAHVADEQRVLSALDGDDQRLLIGLLDALLEPLQ
jgi:DNA-binding MarR family transcriptional regulator